MSILQNQSMVAVVESSAAVSVRIDNTSICSMNADDEDQHNNDDATDGHSSEGDHHLSSSPSRHLTVVDVYDLAAAIGKDFERLIDQFGTDCVRSLMPKVTEIEHWNGEWTDNYHAIVV